MLVQYWIWTFYTDGPNEKANLIRTGCIPLRNYIWGETIGRLLHLAKPILASCFFTRQNSPQKGRRRLCWKPVTAIVALDNLEKNGFGQSKVSRFLAPKSQICHFFCSFRYHKSCKFVNRKSAISCQINLQIANVRWWRIRKFFTIGRRERNISF